MNMLKRNICNPNPITVRRDNVLWWKAFWFIGPISGLSFFYYLNGSAKDNIVFQYLASLFILVSLVGIILGRKKVVSITNDLMVFSPGIPGHKCININLSEINSYKITTKNTIDLLCRYGISAEISHNVLLFSLKKGLSEDNLHIIEKIQKSMLSRYAQIDASENGEELWITNNPIKLYEKIIDIIPSSPRN